MIALHKSFAEDGTPLRSSVAYLAGTFADVLYENMTPPQWQGMRRLNALEGPGSEVCHSHTFLDANEAMEEAFRRCFGVSPMLPSDAWELGEEGAKEADRQMRLWNAAWDLAKVGWLTATRNADGSFVAGD